MNILAAYMIHNSSVLNNIGTKMFLYNWAISYVKMFEKDFPRMVCIFDWSMKIIVSTIGNTRFVLIQTTIFLHTAHYVIYLDKYD